MNLGRIANINIFRKIRQLETLAKPNSLLVQNYNPTQFPRFASTFTNLNRCAIVNNYAKCHIFSKLPAQQSAISMIQIRAMGNQHGDHVRMWVLERLVSLSLLLIIPSALILENKLLDIIMASSIIMHMHWGLEAIIIDYARPVVVGMLFSRLAFFALYVLSAASFAGLLVLIYNGPGLSKVIKKGWAINKETCRDE